MKAPNYYFSSFLDKKNTDCKHFGFEKTEDLTFQRNASSSEFRDDKTFLGSPREYNDPVPNN